MKLTLNGTSNFRVDFPLASAGYVVEAGTTTLKLDFGHGNLLNLAKAGIDWRSFDAIFVSHIHQDHVSDLVKYFQVYVMNVVWSETPRAKPITLYGPPGFAAFFERLKMLVEAPWKAAAITIVETAGDQFTVGDCTVSTALMPHSIPCTGYRIEHNGKVLVYTGDTTISDQVIGLAAGADVLLTECDVDNSEPQSDGHLRPQDVAAIATQAKVKTVVLTHYPGDPAERQRRRAQVAAGCTATVIAGSDNQVITI